jgi:pimeloyl-ACP methyl ester carboxylesterase
LIVLSFFFAAVSWANVEDYGYPYADPLTATVLGTPKALRAKLDDKTPRKEKKIEIFPDRKLPDAVAVRSFQYAITPQDKPAPLVFVIAGTGSSHQAAKVKQLDAALYGAGFHVISLSSPTYTNFIQTASSTRMPGRTAVDAADLYNVMEKIWEANKARIEVTGFHLTGYSLGGANAAFVARLDEEKKRFNFKKVLMINPPVNLYNSVGILDRMLTKNIPGPVAPDFNTFFYKVIKRFSEVYSLNDDLDFNDEFLYRIYEKNLEEGKTTPPEVLEALIGVSFRLSSANMATIADFATQRGWIVPKGHKFSSTESTTRYFKVATRSSFVDYFDELYVPFYRELDPGSTRDSLIRESSLESIESYLRGADKIGVMHNADDVILAPGEIDFFRQVFGNRAKIYPRGGHCGNMAYRDNVTYLVDYFKK